MVGRRASRCASTSCSMYSAVSYTVPTHLTTCHGQAWLYAHISHMSGTLSFAGPLRELTGVMGDSPASRPVLRRLTLDISMRVHFMPTGAIDRMTIPSLPTDIDGWRSRLASTQVQVWMLYQCLRHGAALRLGSARLHVGCPALRALPCNHMPFMVHNMM